MSRRYSSVTWTEICAFWGMVIAGFSHFFGGLFRALVKWAFGNDGNVTHILNNIVNILTLVGNIALLVAIALPAYQFVKYKSKGWRVFYWIAFALFVIGVVFGVAIMF